ncbi:uncharacterized protein LOC142529339 [Primulina tabacum]|uniref:uncharacterized protein LOC142529339 n=1 Tax=Primulina tabacum TaxID=48773 RepID=UPI003F595FEA
MAWKLSYIKSLERKLEKLKELNYCLELDKDELERRIEHLRSDVQRYAHYLHEAEERNKKTQEEFETSQETVAEFIELRDTLVEKIQILKDQNHQLVHQHNQYNEHTDAQIQELHDTVEVLSDQNAVLHGHIEHLQAVIANQDEPEEDPEEDEEVEEDPMDLGLGEEMDGRPVRNNRNPRYNNRNDEEAQQQPPQQPPTPPPPPPAQNGTKQHYEALRRVRVPNFDGSSDPEVGQNWMKEVENHLRLLEQQTMINPVTVGLRFNPTDTELMLLLNKKINNQPLTCDYIRTVDVYKYNPWELADTNTSWGDDGLMYFFTPRDRKYMNGSRPNRAAGDGFWKATAIGKKIFDNNECIGLKRTLVFYQGKASNGKKTNWIMHEYTINQPPRHPTGSMRLDECVLCRIRERKPAAAASDSCKTIHETSENDNLTSHKRSRTEFDQQHDAPAQHHLQLRQPDLPLMHQQFQLRQPDLPLMHQQNQPALQYTGQQHGSVPQQQQNQPGGELDYSVRRRLEEIEHFLMDDLENDDEGVLIDNEFGRLYLRDQILDLALLQ